MFLPKYFGADEMHVAMSSCLQAKFSKSLSVSAHKAYSYESALYSLLSAEISKRMIYYRMPMHDNKSMIN